MSKGPHGGVGFRPDALEEEQRGSSDFLDFDPRAEIPAHERIVARRRTRIIHGRDRSFAAAEPCNSARAHGTLFDNLIALSERQVVRSIVVAPVGEHESTRDLTAGLAAEAARRGLLTLRSRIELRSGMSVLVADCGEAPADKPSRQPTPQTLSPLALDLRCESGQARVGSWLSQAYEGYDIVIVDGAPLNVSIDSALLACACDGLLLLAEQRVSSKIALRMAAERANAAGCYVFGVVVDKARQRLPRWLRALSSN